MDDIDDVEVCLASFNALGVLEGTDYPSLYDLHVQGMEPLPEGFYVTAHIVSTTRH